MGTASDFEERMPTCLGYANKVSDTISALATSRLTRPRKALTLIGMEEIGTRVGKNAEQMVEEAVDPMLEYDERFIAAVEEGRSSARRGELLEHDEVVERIDQLLP